MLIQFQPRYVQGRQPAAQAAQSHIQPGPECLQGWGTHNPPGQCLKRSPPVTPILKAFYANRLSTAKTNLIHKDLKSLNVQIHSITAEHNQLQRPPQMTAGRRGTLPSAAHDQGLGFLLFQQCGCCPQHPYSKPSNT